MKSFNAESQKSELKKAVENVLSYHESYKKAYFWTPPTSASERRRGESNFQSNNPEFEIIDGKNIIHVSPSLSYSAKNVYYHLVIKVNGSFKDIRAIKKYIK